MGKMVKEDRQQKNANNAKIDAPIPHHMRSFSSFIKKLKQDFHHETSNKVLPQIHSLLQKNKGKISFDCKKIKEKLRICKICDKWNNLNAMIQCPTCEDNYHKTCLKQTTKPTFVCTQCQTVSKLPSQCTKCKRPISKSQKRKCDSCSSLYHKQCWKSRSKTCKQCCIPQKKIKSTKKINPQPNQKYVDHENTIHSIRSTLFNFKQLITEKEKQKYTSSLMAAIKDKEMTYSQQLVSMDSFQGILNENSLDFGINFMNHEECKIYQLHKEHPIGPFLLQTIKNKGYDVIADKDIPVKSLICEYIGEVVTLRQCIELEKQEQNDSLMELRAGKNSDETLIIRPQIYTNMARFINGVKKNSSLGNVQSMRLLYQGKPIVLLVAKKQIKKGESLCYDYNAGEIAAEYDTSYFV